MIKDPFTHQIIGLAMETHRALGPGLVEEFYHQDLVSRLNKSGIEHLSKPRRDLIYRGFVADGPSAHEFGGWALLDCLQRRGL